jgi:lauroyl/myristoyl acyltransferase
MSAKDLYEIVMLAVSSIPAWVLPQHKWRWLARFMAHINLWARPRHFRSYKKSIEMTLTRAVQGTPDVDGRQIQLDFVANNYEARYFQILRFYRPGRWTPELRLSGRENIEQALAAGNGAILWVYPFVFYSLVSKMSLAQAGFPPVHLSRPGHGYSNSKLGIRYLNQIQTRAEDYYIAERITLGSEENSSALRLLIRRIRENRVLTITANAEGRKLHSVPFLDGEINLASGAPNLALSTKAALLPTMTVREPSGEFVVHVEPALQAPDDAESRHEGEVVLARQFAQLLEDYVYRYPDQWPKWQDMGLRSM